MYSRDFRHKIILTYKTGDYSYRDLSLKFEVSLTFISNLIQHFKESGEIIKVRDANRVKAFKISGNYELILLDLIEKKPDMTLIEISDHFNDNYNFKVGKSSVDRKLKSLKITYKKKQTITRRKTV